MFILLIIGSRATNPMLAVRMEYVCERGIKSWIWKEYSGSSIGQVGMRVGGLRASGGSWRSGKTLRPFWICLPETQEAGLMPSM